MQTSNVEKIRRAPKGKATYGRPDSKRTYGAKKATIDRKNARKNKQSF